MNLRESVPKDFDFVAIGVGHEGHFARTGCEFRPPVCRPDFDTVLFELVAVGNHVIHAQGSVHEIFGACGGVIRRVAKLEKDVVVRKNEKGEFVSLRRIFEFTELIAEFAIKSYGCIEVANADTGVEKANHGDASKHGIAELPNRNASG